MKVCVKPQGLRFTFTKNIFQVVEKRHESYQDMEQFISAQDCAHLYENVDNVCLR